MQNKNYYKLFTLNKNKNKNKSGELFWYYNYKKLKFKIDRFYFFKNINFDTVKGKHAHRKTKQIFICLKGTVSLRLSNCKKIIKLIKLKEANKKGIIILKPTWLEIFNFSKDCILLVLADRNFSKSDYIFDRSLIK